MTGTQYLTHWVWVQSDNNSCDRVIDAFDAVMALSSAFTDRTVEKSSALLHRRRYIDWLASDTTNFWNAIQSYGYSEDNTPDIAESVQLFRTEILLHSNSILLFFGTVCLTRHTDSLKLTFLVSIATHNPELSIEELIQTFIHSIDSFLSIS